MSGYAPGSIGGFVIGHSRIGMPAAAAIGTRDSLLTKLLRRLNSPFNKDPVAFAAVTVMHASGALNWWVRDGTLSMAQAGGVGGPLSIDLSTVTCASLAAYINAQPGYAASGPSDPALAALSATALIRRSGTAAAAIPAVIQGYTSNLWAYLSACADQIIAVRVAIAGMIEQMNVLTAVGEWLDLWGSYFGIPRLAAETDTAYAPRMVAQVLEPRSNNEAIASALTKATGQKCTVVDTFCFGLTTPLYNNIWTYNGAEYYNATAQIWYGVFDVTINYSSSSGVTLAQYTADVTALINQLRAAGTHLRILTVVPIS